MVTQVWEGTDDIGESSAIDLVCSNVVSGTQDTWDWTSDSSVGMEGLVATVATLVFVINLFIFIPDAVPFIDEILLALVALILGRLKRKPRKESAA